MPAAGTMGPLAEDSVGLVEEYAGGISAGAGSATGVIGPGPDTSVTSGVGTPGFSVAPTGRMGPLFVTNPGSGLGGAGAEVTGVPTGRMGPSFVV
jgi:hypothetical protein